MIYNLIIDGWYWRIRLVDPNWDEKVWKPHQWSWLKRVQLEIDLNTENQLDLEEHKHFDWKLWYGDQ